MIVEGVGREYAEIRIPGLVATKQGTLLRCCECRRATKNDWADIDIKISRSTDRGEHWETALLIPSEGETLNNPVMIVSDERVILLYHKNYRELFQRISTDDGKSFGEAVRVNFEWSVDFFYNAVAVGPGHGIVHKGRLLIPIWFARNTEKPKAHHPSVVSVLCSENGGETWQIGEIFFPHDMVNPSECALAVTKEEDVLISVRHEGEKRMRALAESADGIKNWRALRFADQLPDPVCMGSMTHGDGVIYHVNCAHTTLRQRLTVKASDDGFLTYREIPVSEGGGYADIAILGEELCVLYEKDNENGAKELFFERLPKK